MTLAAWVFLTLGIVLGSRLLHEPGLGRLVVLGPGGTPLPYGGTAPAVPQAGSQPNSALTARIAAAVHLARSPASTLRLGVLKVGARLRLHPARAQKASGKRLSASWCWSMAARCCAVRRARAQGAFAGEQHAVASR